MKISLPALCVLSACQVDQHNVGLTQPQSLGKTRWAIALGGRDNDQANALAIDSIGDVVVIGDAKAANFGSVALAARGEFVTKRVASDGSERWTVPIVPMRSTSSVAAWDVAITADDSIVVVGAYSGTVDFGGQELGTDATSPPTYSDAFVAKYTWDGTLAWVHGLSPKSNATISSVAIDSTGDIAIAGSFLQSQLTLGDTTYSALGKAAGFIGSLDDAGSLQWGHAFIGDLSTAPAPSDIAIAGNDDVLMIGSFSASASLGGAVLDADANRRGFVTRYRRDGLYLSSGVVGLAKPGQAYATDLAVTTGDAVVIQTDEKADFNDLYSLSFSGVHTLDDRTDDVWRIDTPADAVYGSVNRRLATTASMATIPARCWSSAVTATAP